MATVVVTLYAQGSRGTVDLELSADVPVEKLFPPLVKVLFPEDDSPISSYQLFLQHTDGEYHQISPQQTLIEPLDPLRPNLRVLTGSRLALVNAGLPTLPADSPQAKGFLIACESGRVIAVDSYNTSELFIGRYDNRTREMPEIDLSNELGGETVSRKHAKLVKQGNQWTLWPVSQNSLTSVNGEQIPAQQPVVLKVGDRINLGRVKLLVQDSQ